MNHISETQNQAINIRRLSAQRNLYSTAKFFFALQTILSIPIAVGFALVLVFFNDTQLALIGIKKTYLQLIAAIHSLLFLTFDLTILSPHISDLKERAAKIQETFDCEVYSLPWNDILCGTMPDNEEIYMYAKKYQESSNLENLKNWYSVSSEKLPLSVARLLCQRSNCCWDMFLRNKLLNLLLGTSISLFLALLIIALIMEMSLANTIANLVSPLSPVIAFTIRQRLDHKKSMNRWIKIKSTLDATWQKITTSTPSDSSLTLISRSVQDGIYLVRKDSPLVFDWINRWFHNERQESMDYSIEQMSQKYIQNHL